jgi:hypothetical protein
MVKNNEEYVLVDKAILNGLDSTILPLIFENVKNGDSITYSATNGNYTIASHNKTYDQKSFKERKEKYDAVGNDVIVLLLIGFVMFIEYVLRKKKEYQKDPIAAEENEPWTEIGKDDFNDDIGY